MRRICEENENPPTAIDWDRTQKIQTTALMSTLNTIQTIFLITIVVTILACWLIPMPTI